MQAIEKSEHHEKPDLTEFLMQEGNARFIPKKKFSERKGKYIFIIKNHARQRIS